MRRDTPPQIRTLSTTHNYLILSDLHLSEGIDPQSGKTSPVEDFFQDTAFAELLVYHLGLAKEVAADPAFRKPWKLYLNGDFLEFLQVLSLPQTDHPLCTRGGVKLEGNVERFGLGTSQPESVWKLCRIVEGHPLFFQALGWFMAHPDCELIILRGNHDVEFFWPKVREAFLTLIEKQYCRWYKTTSRGLNPDSPLPLNGLSEILPPDFRERVSFPAWFVHEPPLFYMEHGHQYDPQNAFANWLNPVLPDKPHLIELPPGSFFVRYFFNQIEQTHPFADNLRPISRYVNWAINEAFTDTVRMLLRRPSQIWLAIRNLWQKRGRFSQSANLAKGGKAEPLPLAAGQIHLLEGLRHAALAAAEKRSSQTMGRIISRFALHILAWILAAFGLRAFVWGDYLPALAWLGSCGLALLLAARLGGQLQALSNPVALPQIGRQISRILNKEYRGESAAVQLHIFGHDHQATLEEITPRNSPFPFRQWYVNTGSWLPLFDEVDRISRGEVQLAFLRIIPDRPDFHTAVPELLEWRPGSRHPERLRFLE